MRTESALSHERFHRHLSQRQSHGIVSAAGLLEFRVESRWERSIRKIVEVARRSYARVASVPTSRQLLVAGMLVAIVLAVFAFLPSLHLLVWPGTAWALLLVSVIVVFGVIVDILFAMISMYVGYKPTDAHLLASSVEARAGSAAAPARRRADALDHLRIAERKLSELQDRSAFHSLSDGQKKQYFWAIAELRSLMQEIANEIPQCKIAS